MANSPQNIILSPIITEKSLMSQARGVYSFWVSRLSTKTQIASVFHQIFGVKPLAIRTQSLNGKVKSDPRRRQLVHKPDRKKAFVTIDSQQKIELLNLNTK